MSDVVSTPKPEASYLPGGARGDWWFFANQLSRLLGHGLSNDTVTFCVQLTVSKADTCAFCYCSHILVDGVILSPAMQLWK